MFLLLTYGHALRRNVMSGWSGHTFVVHTLTTTGQVVVIPRLTVNGMHVMSAHIHTHGQPQCTHAVEEVNL